MSTCTGCVLAGGSGTRLGGVAKGLLEVGERRILDRVLAALAGASDAQIIISNDPGAQAWVPGVRVVGDLRRERGALAGIHTALVYAETAVLVAAWDMPFLDVGLLRALRSLGERRGSAAIPESATGREPLCAYYPRSARQAAEAVLASGERRVGAFVEALPTIAVFSAAQVAHFGDPKRLFLNVNTPDDLAEARRLAATG